MRVILVVPNSQGLKNSAGIVEQTIKKDLKFCEVTTVIVSNDIILQSVEDNDRQISFQKPIDVVIFFERIVAHTQLRAARHRILIPNPEWLTERVAASISGLTEIWHKTNFSLSTLSAAFPRVKHSYIGFTSADFSGGLPDYRRFIHLAGSSGQKQSEIVLAAWRQHPEWPELSVQSYAQGRGFLNFPEWLQWRNMRFKYYQTTADEYRLEATRAGVHLCPSLVEGFGHYLNEARSMGALIVTTNAPPMNELVDETCAVMVSPVRTEKQHFGVLNFIDIAGFEKAIEQVLQMPQDLRASMGANARQRYLLDREQFQSQLIAQLCRLAQA